MFSSAYSGGVRNPEYGYCADWVDASGYPAVEICAGFAITRGSTRRASWYEGMGVTETRVIEGYPAWVQYSPRVQITATRFR